MDRLNKIAKEVLMQLSLSYKMNIPYYVKDNFEYLLDEDDMFLSDEDIIEAVKHIVSDKYTLKVIPVTRELQCDNPEDNFLYGDTELKLIENENRKNN